VIRALTSCLLLACACAPALSVPGAQAGPLELEVASSNGRRFELAGLRGEPLLLFLFATYDQASQFALVPLTRLAEEDKRVKIIGIALQPEAQKFLPMFQQSIDLPFALYFDPDNHLLGGDTVLGKVGSIPVTIAVDAEGRIRDQWFGALTTRQAEKLRDAALGQ
jgi:peroxiredoxin